MPFIDDILQYKTLSIIGMDKNTGKTECLNYIINRINAINCTKDNHKHYCVGITSIGIDGESIDQVTKTDKPEIELLPGMVFVTSEKHYRTRKLVSEVMMVSKRKTSLGRLVTAKVKHSGKVILSGPSTSSWMGEVIENLLNSGVDLTIVDGALSRKSSGSPIITESLILTTGAAVSPHIPTLIKKTKYLFHLINLPEFSSKTENIIEKLKLIETGIHCIDENNQIHDLQIPSALLLEKYKEQLFKYGYIFYVAGIVGDNLLNLLKAQTEITKTTLVVKDFTRVFATSEVLQSYIKAGGKIEMLHKNKLIAICVNPTSPNGYTLDSHKLCTLLHQELSIPVYDVRQLLLEKQLN